MADLGTAYIRIAPNMTGIQGKIASGFKGAAGQATSALGDEVNSNSGPFQNAVGKLGNIAKVGGLAIATGFAAGTAGLIALTGKMLQSGAQLEQQLGGSEAVFGEFAASIQATAKEAYTNAGLSQNEFLQGANKMGALFQGSGFTVKESMEMSSKAMQLASDTASIMGIDTTAALEAVTGMAKGNFTMMDNLGVKMDDTSIQAYALSKGIKGVNGALSAQEKVGVATQIFLETNAKYAGNYAKENDTLAGSINTTKKAFDDFMSTGDVSGFVESLVKTIQIAVPKIVQALPKLVEGIGSILEAVVPAIADVLPTLVPALIQAVVGLLNALVAALPTIVQVLVDALPIMIDAFVELFLAILDALPEIIRIIADAIPKIVDSIVTALTTPESLQAILLGAVELLTALVEAIPIVMNALTEALPTIVDNMIKTLTSPQFLLAMATAGIKLIGAAISGIRSMASGVLSAAWEIIRTISSAWTWENMSRIGGDLIRGIWNGIKDLSGWILDKIKGFGSSVISGIKGVFGIKSPSTVFAAIGVNLNKGLAEGLDSSARLVSKSMDSIANDALSSISNPLVSADVAFGSTSAGASGIGPNSSVSNQSVSIQKVVLGDESAVRAFFTELNQDVVNIGLGITPKQGAIA